MWKKRPARLTPLAYEWCSAISEAAGSLRQRETELPTPDFGLRRPPILRQPEDGDWGYLPRSVEEEFPEVGIDCDSLRLGGTSSHTRGYSQDPIFYHEILLPTILKIVFCPPATGPDQPALHLNHTSHHERALRIAFSSDDDEVIADAMRAWVVGGDYPPPGSCIAHLSRRMQKGRFFSPKLRQISIRAIEREWRGELKVLMSVIVRLLHRLDVDMCDVEEKSEWTELLVELIRARTRSLSSHYWRFLGKLALAAEHDIGFRSRDVEVMKSLERDEDWEKLEVWMLLVWESLPWRGRLTISVPEDVTLKDTGSMEDSQLVEDVELMEDIDRLTLKLLLRRPSALLKFEGLLELCWANEDTLRHICNEARAEQLPLESPSR